MRRFVREADPRPSMREAPPWPLWVLSAATFLLSTWELSKPGWFLPTSLLCWALWWVVGIWWVVSVAAAVIRHRLRPPLAVLGHRLVPPALVVVVGAFAYSGLPLRARFELSRPEMEQRVAELRESAARRELPDQWLGLYHASDIRRIPGGVRFHVTESGFGDHGGFAFSPDGRPPVIGEDSYWHLTGPWYVWYESW